MQEPTTPLETNNESAVAPPVRPQVSRFDIALWLLVSIISSVLIAMVRWPTFLGVSSLPWLRDGHDYPWRIWWRARDQYVNTSRHVPLYIVMGGAIALVFVGTGLICWLLLTHSSDDPTALNES